MLKLQLLFVKVILELISISSNSAGAISFLISSYKVCGITLELAPISHKPFFPTSYIEKPPFPVRIKDHAKASTVVRKSNIRTYTPPEQVKVKEATISESSPYLVLNLRKISVSIKDLTQSNLGVIPDSLPSSKLLELLNLVLKINIDLW